MPPGVLGLLNTVGVTGEVVILGLQDQEEVQQDTQAMGVLGAAVTNQLLLEQEVVGVVAHGSPVQISALQVWVGVV